MLIQYYLLLIWLPLSALIDIKADFIYIRKPSPEKCTQYENK